MVPECPTPLLGRDILTKLGTTLVMGSFSAPRALQLLVTTEEPITPSIERDQKLWEDKLTPRYGIRGFLDEPTKLNQSSLSSEIPLGFLTGNNILSKETLGTYLGVQITHGSRRLSSDQVQGILQLSSPTTQKQLRAFLGLTGYCRIWIPNYGLNAQPLYESLKGRDDSIPLMWGTPQKKAEATLKQALTQTPALSLPDPEKAFQLYVHERGNNLGSVNSKVGI